MRTLGGNNITTVIPAWAQAVPPYAYDTTPFHCGIGVYDYIYAYDYTRCANSITSSTTVTTKFHGDAGFADNGGWPPDPASGHERELPESGMSYYGYRFYNPDLGRWVNRDPIVEQGWKQINRDILTQQFSFGDIFIDVFFSLEQSSQRIYAFALNSPLKRKDLFGLYVGANAPPTLASCCPDFMIDWRNYNICFDVACADARSYFTERVQYCFSQLLSGGSELGYELCVYFNARRPARRRLRRALRSCPSSECADPAESKKILCVPVQGSEA